MRLNLHGNDASELSFSGCSVTTVAITANIAIATRTPSNIAKIRRDLFFSILVGTFTDLSKDKKTQIN